jgi:hypothetical protein
MADVLTRPGTSPAVTHVAFSVTVVKKIEVDDVDSSGYHALLSIPAWNIRRCADLPPLYPWSMLTVSPASLKKAAEVGGGEVGPPLVGRAKEISGRQPEIPASHQGNRFARARLDFCHHLAEFLAEPSQGYAGPGKAAGYQSSC